MPAYSIALEKALAVAATAHREQVRKGSQVPYIMHPVHAAMILLKYQFPEHVARGIVVPFGAYYQHYRNAKVALPQAGSAPQGVTAGEPLPDFVERTYKQFFEVMIPAKTSERDLTAWIAPRLAQIRERWTQWLTT